MTDIAENLDKSFTHIPSTFSLRIQLCSDTLFSRGEGLAGAVDVEIDHDEYGIPGIRGKVIEGLLVEACSEILWSLFKIRNTHVLTVYESAAKSLFGSPGDEYHEGAILKVGNAEIPSETRWAIKEAVDSKRYTAEDILRSFTTERSQTSNAPNGVPTPGSLRSLRVLNRSIDNNPFVLHSSLKFERPSVLDSEIHSSREVLSLLAACVLLLHRGGLRRNRGLGKLHCTLAANATQRDDKTAYKYTKELLGAFPPRDMDETKKEAETK